MYKINNVIVSESHLIKYKNNWIRVKEHPKAKIICYNKPYLYCLNTSNKVIELSGLIFSDWDEIDDIKFNNLIEQNKNIQNLENIHEYLDDGFDENSIVSLTSLKSNVPIKDIRVGDILENGSIVYGLVEINTRKLRKYNKQKCIKKLYNLLTTDGNFIVNSEKVKDYNNMIDKFII